MVAAGDIELGARDMGINGISAQSGGTIKMTANNMFGLCSGGAPNLFTVPYYRLVLCPYVAAVPPDRGRVLMMMSLAPAGKGGLGCW